MKTHTKIKGFDQPIAQLPESERVIVHPISKANQNKELYNEIKKIVEEVKAVRDSKQ